MQFGSFVFKSKLEFVIATQSIFCEVVGIHYEIMGRTIDRLQRKRWCLPIVELLQDRPSEYLFRLLEPSENPKTDVTITAGYDRMIIGNPGMLSGPNSRKNCVCSCLDPTEFQEPGLPCEIAARPVLVFSPLKYPNCDSLAEFQFMFALKLKSSSSVKSASVGDCNQSNFIFAICTPCEQLDL